jgi:hypothetical protein
MRAYALTTGLVFALIVAAHLARFFAEGPHLLRQPIFAVTSILSMGLTAWAWRIWRRLARSDEKVSEPEPKST